MSDNRYTTTAYYYDAKGRVIQSRSTSIVSGCNITYTAYNFDGTVQQTLSEQGSTEAPMREQYTYSYDHVGRPTQVLYKHNNEPEIRLSENIYDAHGQLSTRFRHNRADTTYYARDVRGALTASVNSRFSERLFYGDSLPQGATACYNGNIAATTVTNGDSTLIFGYTYDAYNRLTESLHLQGNQARSSEFFQFDNMGNITRLQRHTLDNRLIDDLLFAYSGNQVIAITDYAGSLDRYDTKEYTDRLKIASTADKHYDANGNQTMDFDRGIKHIQYNILNLPDTVFFFNGNRIINSYDATGRKWQSQTVTLRESEVMPTDDGTVFDAAISSITLTQYDGTMEYQYRSSRSRPDSLVRTGFVIHNAEGYQEYAYITSAASHTIQMPPRFPIVRVTRYYYHRDHLGNNCAVWDATNNSIAQRTWYYASGTPMSVSTAQGIQPYKYNGKEYIESHGYDTYDYGFRGYYATIGRFTSIDPLTERTPWQSPYTYANNNWINLIDYMGLLGIGVSQGSCNWTAVNKAGEIVGWGTDKGDTRVYQVDDDWDRTYEGLDGYDILGWEIEELRWTYKEGDICYYRGRYQITYVQNGVVTVVASTRLMYGNTPVSNAQIDNSFQAALHYFWGNGYAAYLGGPFTEKEVLQNKEFQDSLSLIRNMETGTRGAFRLDMTLHVFHIGDTRVRYFIREEDILCQVGYMDGCWDVLSLFEKSKYNPWGIVGDKKGPKLELPHGHPYNYIPMDIVLPR